MENELDRIVCRERMPFWIQQTSIHLPVAFLPLRPPPLRAPKSNIGSSIRWLSSARLGFVATHDIVKSPVSQAQIVGQLDRDSASSSCWL